MKFASLILTLCLSLGPIWAVQAAAVIGELAPVFKAVASDGKPYALDQFRGKTVVLEWTNHDCPFVRKHYDSKNMQSLQKDAARDGVIWLSVVSSGPGKQGFVDAAQANALTQSRGAAPQAVLLDPSGDIGRLYGARTTPHMFVIDSKGQLAYAGGIDDIASSDAADVPRAKNLVRLALGDIAAGRPVAVASAKPYGCSVKYDK